MTNEMTNEEAIELLKEKRMEINYQVNGTTQFSKALDMAIKALETASCIKEKCAYCPHCEHCDVDDETLAIKVLEQQPSKEWKEIYAESEGSNSWIEFKCPHCGYSFGMESGEYDWHYGDEIPWKYCPICGGSAEHKPYKAESETP